MPSEPAESNFKDKVKIKSYRCHERNGVIWAYMGPRAVPPPLPELEGNMYPNHYISVLYRKNNWMQGIEGEIDTLHAAFLHAGHARPENLPPGSFAYYMSKSRAGKFSVRETDCGTSYGMYRPAEEDSYYWRTGHLLFPCFAMPPVPTLGVESRFLAYVPMDDENTLEWSIGPGANEGLGAGFMVGREYLNNGTGWYDRYVIEQTLGERLSDRPRGPAYDEELVRHRGRPPAGHGDDRGHGPHPRPHQRAPWHNRPDDHPHPPPPAGSRPSARRGRRAAPRRRQPRLVPQALRPSHPPPHRQLVGGHPPPTRAL